MKKPPAALVGGSFCGRGSVSLFAVGHVLDVSAVKQFAKRRFLSVVRFRGAVKVHSAILAKVVIQVAKSAKKPTRATTVAAFHFLPLIRPRTRPGL